MSLATLNKFLLDERAIWQGVNLTDRKAGNKLSYTNLGSTWYTENGCSWERRPCCTSPCKYRILLPSPHQFRRPFLYQIDLFSYTWKHKLLSVYGHLFLLFLVEVAIRMEIWHLFFNRKNVKKMIMNKNGMH